MFPLGSLLFRKALNLRGCFPDEERSHTLTLLFQRALATILDGGPRVSRVLFPSEVCTLRKGAIRSMIPPKPLPRKFYIPKPQRLPERKPRSMTLIAAFRASKGGVLLCSDRQEDDGVSKRSIEKIYPIKHLKSCEIFMAGAGPSTPVKNAFLEIHKNLKQQEDGGLEVAWEHREVIEKSLKSIHERYEDVLQNWPINLIIVIAPRARNYTPMLYSTDGKMLSPESRYITHGSGKGVADYLASRLFSDDLKEHWLLVMAAFIFREAGESSAGVGFGSDMIMINNGRVGRREIGHIPVSEVEHALPLLADCLQANWLELDKMHRFPSWLYND